MIKKINILAFALISFAGTSCMEVINLDLNTAAPKVIIVGNISDNAAQPQRVTLTRSINFSESDKNSPAISNATVTVTDNLGNVGVFAQTVPNSGVYENTTLRGVVGRTYTMKVTVDNQVFTSVSTMPPVVPFDSLIAVNGAIFGGSPKNFLIFPLYTDTKGVANFYRFNQMINGRILPTVAEDDAFVDGKTRAQPLSPGGGPGGNPPKLNDEVVVEMQTIDKNVYQYFNTLDQASSGQSVPANPDTNITGGAFGYFSAHTTQRRSLIVQ